MQLFIFKVKFILMHNYYASNIILTRKSTFI